MLYDENLLCNQLNIGGGIWQLFFLPNSYADPYVDNPLSIQYDKTII